MVVLPTPPLEGRSAIPASVLDLTQNEVGETSTSHWPPTMRIFVSNTETLRSIVKLTFVVTKLTARLNSVTLPF